MQGTAKIALLNSPGPGIEVGFQTITTTTDVQNAYVQHSFKKGIVGRGSCRLGALTGMGGTVWKL